jgi:hypothetical protein
MSKNNRIIMHSVTMFAACLLLTGCMSFNPRSLRQMENALHDSNPGMEFESTTKFGVGPMTMNLVDFIFVHDRDFDVSKISRADVGVYELKRPLNVDGFAVPKGNDRTCPRSEVIIRVVEEDEHVEIAVCIRNEKIVGLAMFVLNPMEIVVINARGDIDALVGSMVRNNANRKPRRVAEKT